MDRVRQRSDHHANWRPKPLRYALLTVVGLIILAGCATPQRELSQEVQGLLEQEAEAKNRRQTTRMDSAIAHLHAEVARLQAAVDYTDDLLGTLTGRIQTLEQQLAASERHSTQDLMLLTGRMQALERQLAAQAEPFGPSPEQASKLPADRGSQARQPTRQGSVFAQPGPSPHGITLGMTQAEVLRRFGQPHSTERVSNFIYWYYAEGELAGQYVCFDATTDRVIARGGLNP
jgi:uncharacterized coiled-coil protein SlyX